jgi:hypothetical protein
MKKALLFFVVTLFVSCYQAPKKEEKKVEPKKLKIENFLNDLMNKKKNWNQNDIIREKFNKEFKKALKSQIDSGLFCDFPLELEEIKEYKKGKYAAHFNSRYIKKSVTYVDILDNIDFDLIGIVSPELVGKLEQGKTYGLKGKFKKFLTSDYDNYIDGLVYTPNVGFETDIILHVTVVEMGIILMEISEATPLKRL